MTAERPGLCSNPPVPPFAAANNDEEGLSSKFERETVAKMEEVLSSSRNTDTDGSVHVRMTGASIASTRRSLLDSDKMLKVQCA